MGIRSTSSQKRLKQLSKTKSSNKIKLNSQFSYYPKCPDGLIIITDTREQNPYKFNDIDIDYKTEVNTLNFGDYSIKGMEMEISIERKELTDFYGSIGSGRDRFQRMLDRMQEAKFKGLLIEASEDEILCPQFSYSEMHPNSIYGTIISIEIKYGVHIYMGSREMCRMRLINWLVKYYKENG